ncbi:MAG: ABC transporter substrate-binding protein [Pseudomonadota bacterium]
MPLSMPSIFFASSRILLVVLLVALILCGCSEVPPDEESEIYRHSEDEAPSSLDPAQAATVYSNMVVVNVFDTLYRYKYLARPYEITPNLALDLPVSSNNGLTYTIRIRPGVEFADDPAFPDGIGREVTVHDLIYSIQRHFDPNVRSQGAWLWSGRIVGLDEWGENGADYAAAIEGLRAIDDYTLEINLTAPYPQLAYTLATGFSALVPREAVEHYGREFAVKPVGSGPFRLNSFNSALATFERNPKFDRGTLDLSAEGYSAERHGEFGLEALDGQRYPFVDGLEIHFIEENAARWNSFISGEVHNVMVPNEQIDVVLESRDPIQLNDELAARFYKHSAQEAGFVYAGFNMADERFGHHPDPQQDAANRALRCAVRDAFDWPARNETFYFGLGQIFPGVIVPMVPEFDASLPTRSVERNVEAANRALDDFGWRDNLPTLSYGMPSSVQMRQMFEQFRAQLQDIGFATDQFLPESFATFGDFSRAMKERQLDLFFLGWTLDYPDAQNTLQLFYSPNATPGSNNFNYSNPDFDVLYEQTLNMQPGPERTALYRRMNEIVVDDCVAISGLSRTRIHLWDKQVRMMPDREILGGFFMRFVDLADDPGEAAVND